MDKDKLAHHIKLCKRNLKSSKTTCCAKCPFEAEIVAEYPEMAKLFKEKQNPPPWHICTDGSRVRGKQSDCFLCQNGAWQGDER